MMEVPYLTERRKKLQAYHSHRPAMQTGDLLVWKSDNVVGRLIRKLTHAQVNHAGLIIRFQQYDQDRVYTLEALDSGIVLRALSERVKNHKGRAWWYPLKEEYSKARSNVGRTALCYVGVKYDFRSLFRQAMARASVEASRLFCSEYVYLVWRDAGIVPEDMHEREGKKGAPYPGGLPGLGVIEEGKQIL
jgi:hypothetical protein